MRHYDKLEQYELLQLLDKLLPNELVEAEGKIGHVGLFYHYDKLGYYELLRFFDQIANYELVTLCDKIPSFRVDFHG